MKRKILSLIILALCLCLCFALASCGEDEKDNKKGSGKNEVTFDSVVETLEKNAVKDSRSEFDISDDKNEIAEILYDFFGSEVIENFNGEITNSLVCDQSGWGVVVLECKDKDDAENLLNAIESYSRYDDFYIRKVENLVFAGSSEYIIDVAIGEEEFDADKVSKSSIGYQ